MTEKEVDPMIAAFYGGTEVEELPEVKEEKVIPEVKEELKPEEKIEPEVKAEVKEEPKEEPKIWTPEFKTETDKALYDKLSKGEQKEVYEMLRSQFEHESYDDDQKMLTFLERKYPHLNKEDLAFKAANEYGIGVTDLPDTLTDEDKRILKSQEIDRKGLLSEADKFFKDQAKGIELPALPNPLETDEGYKNYQEQTKQQVELQAKYDENYTNLIKDIDGQKIESLPIEVKIELDDSEFAISSTFVLDEAKRKQLAEYTKVYTPTEEEAKKFTREGKLATGEYMAFLGKKLFAEQIQSAAIKEAIAKDREQFTEKTLKNSTLRNNETMQQAIPVADFHIDAMNAGT